MKIAICDDNAVERRRLRSLVTMYCERHSLDAEVREFSSGAELLHHMKLTNYSIVFMDIFLEEEHGIKIGQVIRKQYPDCILFFCTISKKYALESYELNALHYLLKPIDYRHVEKALDRCGDKLRSQARTILVSIKPEIRVLVKDILFVEIYDKNCHIHTDGEILTMRRTIRQLETELGKPSFLRCHRSFIVNLEHVREYGHADFVLDNGEHVPIRQAGRSRVKQVFRDYTTLRLPETTEV